MEVRPGYQQTEAGVIPEDWEVKRLGEIGESLIGLTYKPTDVRSDGVLVLRSSNIHEGSLRFEDNVFVEVEVPERLMVRPGDILICVRNGSRDLIGKCAQIDKRAQGMTFGAFMAIFKSPFHAFVFHQFQSWVIKRQIYEHLGATINQITNKSLNSFAIPLPPTKAEQEAIAEALSDADALIESLERLLAKKRQVKQGAMQELLTGQKRLPGFSGEWEVRPGYQQTEAGVIPEDWEVMAIGSLGTFSKGQGIRKDEVRSGDIPCIRYGEIYTHHNDIIRSFYSYISSEVAKSSKRLRQGDILFAGSGETKEDIGKCIAFVGDEEAYAGGDIVIFSPNKGVSSFFGYLFNAPIVARQKASKGQGDAVVHIRVSALSSIKIPLPPKAEQTAIAGVLSDMDAEIAALEAKLGKARQIKQGMMQELLTGRTRLI